MKPRAFRLIAVGLFAATVPSVPLAAQSPPAHPRLLFTAAQRPAIQTRVNGSSPAASAYAQCATGVYLQTAGALPSVSNQNAFVVMRSLRRMQEVAFRYQMTSDPAAGASAKAMLLDVITKLTPTGSTAYQTASYPGAVALTYDMIHGLLSASERSSVVAHLEAWVDAIRAGANGFAGYSSYTSAIDNHALAWSTGVSLSLLAIWGESGYPNLLGEAQANLQKLKDGWRDAISPDGSVDESYGYSNYGNTYSMLAGIAAINCGLGDYLAGTNVLKTPSWVGASLMGAAFEWMGDSSAAHKGERMDPILYYAVGRTGDSAAFWGLERVFALEPPSDSSPSQAFSPFVNMAMFYPLNLQPQAPGVGSMFFRDNLNEGSAGSNKLVAYFQVGLGGHALLHNSVSSAATGMDALYMIRDEWMNHAHEDDGHLSLASEGVHFYVDLGYANVSTYDFAQSVDHNIVNVAGVGGFNGDHNNYYNPPEPAGRFYGKREASIFTPDFDYVRGDHANMWMMQEGTRSVVMIKDYSHPYTILVDRVRKDGNVRTYEELFHSAGPASGAGTAQNPMVINASGRTLRATWLSPAQFSVVPGSAANSSGGVAFWRHKVTTSGVDATFVSVHSKDGLGSVAPLSSPLANTSGGTAVWPGASDKILARSSGSTMGDDLTRTDGRFAWIRSVNGAIEGWAVAEATALVHDDETLLASSAPVVVSARNHRVDIARVMPDAATLAITVFAPFVCTEVTIDGAPVTFTQFAGRIVIGASSTFSPSNLDRAYTFSEGFLWDATLEGPTVLNQGTLTSASGWAGLRVRGGQPLAARPFSLSTEVQFAPGASSTVAGIVVETAIGAVDLFSADLAPGAGGAVNVTLRAGGQTLASLPVQGDLGGHGGRAQLVCQPATGNVQIVDVLGVVRATVAIAPITGPFRARVRTTPSASLDNILYFDSEEDGVTPQGIAFYGLPSGRVGYAGSTNHLLLFEDGRILANGAPVDPWLAVAWMIAADLREIAVSRSIAPGSPNALTLRELILETTHPGAFPSVGFTIGASLETATSQDLSGGWTY